MSFAHARVPSQAEETTARVPADEWNCMPARISPILPTDAILDSGPLLATLPQR
jgi:hypothetical protein